MAGRAHGGSGSNEQIADALELARTALVEVARTFDDLDAETITCDTWLEALAALGRSQ